MAEAIDNVLEAIPEQFGGFWGGLLVSGYMMYNQKSLTANQYLYLFGGAIATSYLLVYLGVESYPLVVAGSAVGGYAFYTQGS